ncbi:MAG TPA: hypothetical protein VJ436_11315 [Anaerolineales bacterium]|nr:hypothetical protein [Anaerolineales bacterium]
MSGKLIQFETRAGEAIYSGPLTLIPLVHSLRIRFPRMRGGLVWNRPASIVVRDAEGGEHALPVPDPTRRAQLVLLGSGLVGALLIWSAFRSSGRKR